MHGLGCRFVHRVETPLIEANAQPVQRKYDQQECKQHPGEYRFAPDGVFLLHGKPAFYGYAAF
jgi:hypothetical protein